ncbi:putative ribonuclease H-like domain-containing protein [Tanacetum coccineum]
MATCHHLSGATWRKHCSPPSPVNLRSTAAGPPVNGGQRRRSTVVNDEANISQPLGFEDPYFPDRVYKFKKALYGLHQAPRAWYETLSTYMLDNEFQRGKIDKTLFIKRYKGDILLVQVYVDDIIFGSTKKELCNAFKKLMHEKFLDDSWENLPSFGLTSLTKFKTASTPMETQKPLLKEEDVKKDLQLEDDEGVDCLPNATIFEQLALMGAKTTAWNEFSSTMASAIICLATNHKFNFSKYIFESMVKNLDNVGFFLMYPRFVQVFLDQQLEGMSSNKRIYVTPSHTKKIFRNMKRVGKGFSRRETPLFQTMVVQAQAKMGEGSAIPTDPHHTPTIIQPSTSQPQKKQKPRKPKRKDTQIPQSSGPTEHVADEAVYKELDDSLVRAATTASSLEAEQDSGNIAKTQSKATPNESSSLGTTSGGGPRRQETMGDTIAQTRFENVSKLSNDPLLARGNTLRSGEDSLKLNELMELCTNLQTRVLDLEKTKTTQAEEIVSLKRRVKKLEQKKRSRTHGLQRLYKVSLTARVESSRDKEDLGKDASKQGRRIHDIDDDEDITLVNDQDDADMFDVNTLTGGEVLAEPEVVVKDVNLTIDEVTLAQALAALKSVKPKVKANVVEEPSVPVSAASTKVSAATTTTTATIPTPRKGIVITELGQRQRNNGRRTCGVYEKKDLVRLDEEIASKLQAEFDEEERLAREKDEANVALTEEWDDIQAKVDADYQLAQRLQAQEQEELTDEEKARLFVQFLEQRRKHFAAKRAEEKRNKPPTQAQQRKIMCTYLKNMEGKKPKDLKNKSFDSIQKMFDKAFKRVNTFVDFRTDLVEGSSKRAGTELEQKVTKKQKMDDVQEIAKVDNDQEVSKIKELVEIVPDKEEVAIDAIPLAVKPPSIMYLVFSHMLKNVDSEDLETLWKLVKAKHGSTRPEEGYERVLWGDLKDATHVDQYVGREEISPYTCYNYRYVKQEASCDHFSEMAYQLLKLLIKQLKNQ